MNKTERYMNLRFDGPHERSLLPELPNGQLGRRVQQRHGQAPVAKGGQMNEATIGGQKFNFTWR